MREVTEINEMGDKKSNAKGMCSQRLHLLRKLRMLEMYFSSSGVYTIPATLKATSKIRYVDLTKGGCWEVVE